MALIKSKNDKTCNYIMEGILEIKAFDNNMTCVGDHPLKKGEKCEGVVMMITVVGAVYNISCSSYCIDHLFLLDVYVKLGSHIDMEA